MHETNVLWCIEKGGNDMWDADSINFDDKPKKNKHPRYVNIITIILFNFEVSFKIGNPLWVTEEFKNIKGGKHYAKSRKKCSKD